MLLTLYSNLIFIPSFLLKPNQQLLKSKKKRILNIFNNLHCHSIKSTTRTKKKYKTYTCRNDYMLIGKTINSIDQKQWDSI